MRFKHHYCVEEKERLLSFLNKNEIQYKLSYWSVSHKQMCVFDLYEDQDYYKPFVRQFPLLELGSIKSTEYSKKEIDGAEWLSIRSLGTKVSWEYEDSSFKKTCPYKRLFIRDTYYRHSEQVAPLAVSKTTKWGAKQYFSGPNAADDLLFCSDKAKQVLGNMWEGLEFWDVNKYKKSEKVPDLYQMVFTKTLPIESISGGTEMLCVGCKKKMIRFTEGIHKLEIRKEYLTNTNSVYRTGDVLTQELRAHNTFSLNIVSKKFYQFCEENQMNHGMVYEPINLI